MKKFGQFNNIIYNPQKSEFKNTEDDHADFFEPAPPFQDPVEAQQTDTHIEETPQQPTVDESYYDVPDYYKTPQPQQKQPDPAPSSADGLTPKAQQYLDFLKIHNKSRQTIQKQAVPKQPAPKQTAPKPAASKKAASKKNKV